MVRKAFELAERLGGMTALELMSRMTVRELWLWVEYDNTTVTKEDYGLAAVLAKLDWIKGVKKPRMDIYLPGHAKKRRRKSLAEIKTMFLCAVANSAKAPTRGR